MTKEDQRVSLNVPSRMKLAILAAAASQNKNTSDWCRDALEAALKSLGVNITWVAYRYRGGFRGPRKKKGTDAGAAD